MRSVLGQRRVDQLVDAGLAERSQLDALHVARAHGARDDRVQRMRCRSARRCGTRTTIRMRASCSVPIRNCSRSSVTRVGPMRVVDRPRRAVAPTPAARSVAATRSNSRRLSTGSSPVGAANPAPAAGAPPSAVELGEDVDDRAHRRRRVLEARGAIARMPRGRCRHSSSISRVLPAPASPETNAIGAFARPAARRARSAKRPQLALATDEPRAVQRGRDQPRLLRAACGGAQGTSEREKRRNSCSAGASSRY